MDTQKPSATPPFGVPKIQNGVRKNILRKEVFIPLQSASSILADILNQIYLPQIRNSIAHSNFSFLGRSIHPNNHFENDSDAQLKYLSFDQWIDIFHFTLLLHNELINLKTSIKSYYIDIAKKQGSIPVVITKLDGSSYTKPVIYRSEFDDFRTKT